MPDYPNSWTPGAVDAYEAVLAERPDIAGADHASLEHACALTAAADELDAIARAAGFMAAGSRAQARVHPATVEARLARSAAAAIFARLVPDRRARATDKARKAARARHEGRAL